MRGRQRIVAIALAVTLGGVMLLRPVMYALRRMRRTAPATTAALVPSGEIGVAPPRFYFPERAGIVRYRIVVTDPAGREVASVEGPGPPLILPEVVGRSLERGVAYAWRLEETDARGAKRAGPRARFVIR